MTGPSTGWRVLVRPECGLCTELLSQLRAILTPAQAAAVAVVDIDEHPDLRRRYGTRIPVLMIDDEMVCCYRLDMDRIRPYLD